MAAVMVVAILLRVLGANPHNVIVSDVHDIGQVLVGPFKGIFSVVAVSLKKKVNWRIAALVYLALGHLVARTVAYAVPRRRRERPAV